MARAEDLTKRVGKREKDLAKLAKDEVSDAEVSKAAVESAQAARDARRRADAAESRYAKPRLSSRNPRRRRRQSPVAHRHR